MKLSAILILMLTSLPLAAETTTYRMLFGGEDTGHLVVDQHINQIAIDFDYKQNGRGPTIAEEITARAIPGCELGLDSVDIGLHVLA